MNLPKLNLVELSTPVLLLSWAAWFIAFDVVGKSPSFSAGRFLTNEAWALAFAALAALKAAAVVRRHPRLRLAAVWLCAALWAIVLCVALNSSLESLLAPTAAFFVYQSFLSRQKLRAAPPEG